jgi:hypothetical protein
MKEARIIIPRETNDGKPVSLDTYERALCAYFGGFTRTDGQGGFMGVSLVYHEPVAIYDVAMKDTRRENDKLQALAERVKRELDQEAVYIRDTRGDVHFI